MFALVTTGLGSKVEDICGRDWVESGGDHGDPGHIYFHSASMTLYLSDILCPLEGYHALLLGIEKIKSISYTTISEFCLTTAPFSPISMHQPFM